jgi:hypothetical protein
VKLTPKPAVIIPPKELLTGATGFVGVLPLRIDPTLTRPTDEIVQIFPVTLVAVRMLSTTPEGKNSNPPAGLPVWTTS